jgi:hypothetical protein
MAKTKVVLSQDVNNEIEKRFGVKIDGTITLSDVMAVVALTFKVLKLPEVKVIVGGALDEFAKKLSESKSKIDDLFIPAIQIFKKVLGL